MSVKCTLDGFIALLEEQIGRMCTLFVNEVMKYNLKKTFEYYHIFMLGILK